MNSEAPEILAETPALPERQAAILAAAFDVFQRFGFRRTSMQDIARAAGLSRAALYLHFANKEDILRNMVQAYFDTTLVAVQAALEPGQKPKKVLGALFQAKVGPQMQALMASPHAAELWEANMALCADLVKQGEARVAAALTRWLQAESDAGRLKLASGDTAEGHADVILAALAGIKDPTQGHATFDARAKRLAWMFGRALSP